MTIAAVLIVISFSTSISKVSLVILYVSSNEPITKSWIKATSSVLGGFSMTYIATLLI